MEVLRPDRRGADEVRLSLATALGGPLPGEAAHRAALPAGYVRPIQGIEPVRAAAVLLAIGPGVDPGAFQFPLIERPDTMPHHAGQIALPGGEIEPGEEVVACALREAWEEIGIAAQNVEVLGSLSPIEIPVSGYRVSSIVGWLGEPATYRPQAGEVLRILRADPDGLAREGPTARRVRVRDGQSWDFPAYEVEGCVVWGATALILSEFLEVWRQVRSIPRPA
jgi:ADP-ribose pyrophosphatase YjhB (NUDIX family)